MTRIYYENKYKYKILINISRILKSQFYKSMKINKNWYTITSIIKLQTGNGNRIGLLCTLLYLART